MTTPEIRAKIQKLTDKQFPAMAESVKNFLMASHVQSLAHYEVALHTSRAADALEKLVKVIDTFGVGVVQVPTSGTEMPDVSKIGANLAIKDL